MADMNLTDEQISEVYAKVLGDKDTCIYMLRNIIFKMQSILEKVENDEITPTDAMASLMTAYTQPQQ
jgi:UTP-glucose-1-phosphate uridylyltransferase